MTTGHGLNPFAADFEPPSLAGKLKRLVIGGATAQQGGGAPGATAAAAAAGHAAPSHRPAPVYGGAAARQQPSPRNGHDEIEFLEDLMFERPQSGASLEHSADNDTPHASFVGPSPMPSPSVCSPCHQSLLAATEEVPSSSRAAAEVQAMEERTEVTTHCETEASAAAASTSGRTKLGPSDFEMLRVVGQGAFGKVFQVRKRDTGEIFAMKVMRKDRIVERDHKDYVRAERDVLTAVVHPYIVTLRYSFQTPHKLYLVLDFLNGGHLFFQLYRQGTFEEALARLYTAEIVLAIAHLHGLGFVHRDLKPENVLLDSEGHIKARTPEGGSGATPAPAALRPRLRFQLLSPLPSPPLSIPSLPPLPHLMQVTDFGLAKINISDAEHERTNSFIGTMEYMAPEIISAKGHGKAVDWWSVGVLLFEMLCGVPPFRAKGRNQLQKLITAAKFKLPPYLSTEAHSLVKGLLQKDPTRRLGYGPTGSQARRERAGAGRCGGASAARVPPPHTGGRAERRRARGWADRRPPAALPAPLQDVMRHPFFRPVDWKMLEARQVLSPFKPTIKSIESVENFDAIWTDLPDSPCPTPRQGQSLDEKLFGGWSYVAGGLAEALQHAEAQARCLGGEPDPGLRTLKECEDPGCPPTVLRTIAE
eukprot:scaffold7.g3629.t1